MPRDDDLIPTAVRRRLTLNRLGFRLRAGAWVHPDRPLVLTEEVVDRMSPRPGRAPWPAGARRPREKESPQCRPDDVRPGAAPPPRPPLTAMMAPLSPGMAESADPIKKRTRVRERRD
jgi:hypothetical protein